MVIRSTRAAVAGAVFFALVSAPRAQALEIGQDNSLLSVEVHGFATQGFILTTDNDYLEPNTTKGSFQYSEIGLNFTKPLVDRLTLGVQLFAQNLGPNGNYNATLDWAYLDYHFRDWLGLRAGRIQIPYGLYNEIQDIDAARTPVLLPQSVYPLQSTTFLFAQTGVELYGFYRMGEFGALDYRLFGGTIYLDPGALVPTGSGIQLSFNVPYVTGGRVIWETPLPRLRIGFSAETLKLNTTAFVPSLNPIHITDHGVLWVVSAEYAFHGLTLTSEYSRWYSRQFSDTPAISPQLNSYSERGYLMATYHVTPWFQPGLYYAIYFPDIFDRQGIANYQHDVAGTLRFDINDHWLVKLEGHFMDGTAGLVSPLTVNGPDVSKDAQYWAAFFIATTAYF